MPDPKELILALLEKECDEFIATVFPTAGDAQKAVMRQCFMAGMLSAALKISGTNDAFANSCVALCQRHIEKKREDESRETAGVEGEERKEGSR